MYREETVIDHIKELSPLPHTCYTNENNTPGNHNILSPVMKGRFYALML